MEGHEIGGRSEDRAAPGGGRADRPEVPDREWREIAPRGDDPAAAPGVPATPNGSPPAGSPQPGDAPAAASPGKPAAPRRRRSLPWTIALVAALLAAAGGVISAHFSSEVKALEGELARREGGAAVGDSEVLAELERRVESLGAELDAARSQGVQAGERAREAEERARDAEGLVRRWPDLQREHDALAARVAELEGVERELEAEGVLLRGRIGELEGDLDAARRAGEADAAQRERAGLLELELVEARASLDSLGEELAAERLERERLEQRAAELDEERRARGVAEAALEAGRTRVSELERDLAEARASGERNRELSAELERERASNRRLQAELEDVRVRASPEGRRVAAWDEILALLEADAGLRALEAFESHERQGTFGAAPGETARLVREVCAAGAALEAAARAEGSTPPVRELFAARDHLRDAAARRDALVPSNGGGEPPDLDLARVNRVLAGLETRLESALGEEAELHREDWDRILEGGVRQDPRPALAHARDFDCAHAEDLAAAYAAGLASEVERNGELDLEALADAAHLALWGRHVQSRAPEARSEVEERILWLWFAARWYLGGDGESGELDWSEVGASAVPAGAPWRAVLLLEVALASEGVGWPPPRDRVCIYRIEGESRARWRADWLAKDGDSSETSVLTRAHFDAEGRALGEPSRVEIERDGRRFRYAGSDQDLLDLGASDSGTRVAPLPDLGRTEPPPQTGVTRADLTAFRALWEDGTRACLVQRRGSWTRWYSPGLGLVREEFEGPSGTVRIELACLVGLP